MWQRCMSHDTVHTPAPRQRHTRELTYKGRSEVAINVGFQYLSFESAVEGLPMKPVSRECRGCISVETVGSRKVGNMDDVENGLNRQV